MLLRRILVVEDDPDTREMLARFLEIAGYQVAQAANGLEALAVLQSGAAASVILLDLMMPVMDGWQFRDEQRRDPSLSQIPVVVVTAAGPRDRVPPIEVDAWLAKPIDLDGLLETLETFCPA